MKYIVEVDGVRHEVEFGPDGAMLDGVPVDVTLTDVPGSPVRHLRIGRDVHRIFTRRDGARGRYGVLHRGHRFIAEALDERTRAIRDLTAASTASSGPAPLLAPMPGMIVRVSVQVGDAVSAGQGLIVMEAMKMENELRATSAGTVTAVRVVTGTAVQKGEILIELA